MPRYKCTIEYCGTKFSGWQKQQEHVSTVQQAIEEAITKLTNENPRLHVSGRTDAGVHAFAQVAHFDIIKKIDTETVKSALNFHIRPHEISIIEVQKTDEKFHARFSAKKRYYVYKIINRRSPLAIDNKRAWHVSVVLDVDAMQKAANFMLGEHDFTSFRDSQCQAKSPIKTIDEIRIEQNGELIEIHVSAQSFLHHMVRNIVGTLKYVGDGKWQPEYVKEIIAQKNRCAAGPTAPAHGLYFVKVDY